MSFSVINSHQKRKQEEEEKKVRSNQAKRRRRRTSSLTSHPVSNGAVDDDSMNDSEGLTGTHSSSMVHNENENFTDTHQLLKRQGLDHTHYYITLEGDESGRGTYRDSDKVVMVTIDSIVH